MSNVVNMPTKEKQMLVGWLRYLADKIEKDGEDAPIDVISLAYVTDGGALYSYRSGNRYDSLSEIGLLRTVSLHVEAKTANLIDD